MKISRKKLSMIKESIVILQKKSFRYVQMYEIISGLALDFPAILK